jgi:hypothetical protein
MTDGLGRGWLSGVGKSHAHDDRDFHGKLPQSSGNISRVAISGTI